MKRSITTYTAVALVALLATALPAAAATVTYTIDKAHSEATFQVRHLVSKVSGEFKQFDGTIKMDRDNPAASSVSFTIDAASINTDVADRDKHLRSADFFDVEKYPTITFESTKIESKGGDEYAVTGNLTMRGVTKQITLPVTFLGEVKDPWGNTKAGFETSTTLNRKDYGINWNKTLDQGGVLVSDDVKIDVNLEVKKEAPAKEAPAAG